MNAPYVVIVILNWNNIVDTLQCLASVLTIDYPHFHVIVVDNGSTDGTVQAVRERYPAVSIIENSENLGYAEGNNGGLGAALAQGAEWILLLNNDSEVAFDFLSYLIQAADSQKGTAILGPTIYYYSDPQRIWSAGGFIDWKRGLPYLRGLNTLDQGQFHTPTLVDYVTGCALLVHRSVVEQVGLLDEQFFMYFEEVEWCVRATRAGFRILHVPEAKVWHKISPEQQFASPRITYYMTRNHLLFLKKTGAGPTAWAYTLLDGILRPLLSWSIKPKWRHKRNQRDAMLRGFLDYCRGRFGRAEIK